MRRPGTFVWSSSEREKVDLNYLSWHCNGVLDAHYCMRGVVPGRQGDRAVFCVGEAGLGAREHGEVAGDD